MLELSKILQDKKQQASEGGFSKRHGIRQLPFQGEKLSTDREAANQFITNFRKLVEVKKFSHNQVF